MGIRLVYGLKTADIAYLRTFYPSRRLAEAAATLDIDYDATIYNPTSPRAAIDFCRGHVAVLRGELPIDLYATLESEGIVVVNNAAATALAADKLRAAERFIAMGAIHPTTCGLDRSAFNPPLAYPFVAKPRFGKMGRGVLLIESPDQWTSFRRSPEAVSSEYIAQEYVASSRGRDLRWFFARFERPGPVAVLRRGPGLASNAHAGGSMEPFDPPTAVRSEAERIFADSGLVYGTVDFLFADERGSTFAVCEINSYPGFETFEKATGLDAARAILLAATEAGGIS